MDWNNDGKHDHRDDALFHNVINKDSGGNTPPPTSNHPRRSGWLPILAILYLSLLIPGDIPVNGFTGFLSLVCIGILIISFLKLIY